MKLLARLAAIAVLVFAPLAFANAAESIEAAIGHGDRPESNTERDGARKPAQVLEFMALDEGDVVLDFGAGGGYWAELFSSVVGADGKVYAHQNAGQRYDENEAAWSEQFAPFGNIELLPVERGSALPLADGFGRRRDDFLPVPSHALRRGLRRCAAGKFQGPVR